MAASTPDDFTTETIVPSSWPGAFGLFKYSKQAVKINIWILVGLYALNVLLNVLFNALFRRGGQYGHPAQILDSLSSLFFGVAMTWTLIASARAQKVTVSDALRTSLSLYLRTVALSVISTIVLVLSLVLFIIPFFIVAPRLALAMYFLVDQNLGPIEALKASWNTTRGNVGKVWGIIGANIVFALLIVVLIGIYFLIFYAAAEAILYIYLTNKVSQAE